MAQQTYLYIVNSVLKKLREDTVTSVTYNDYSTLIGEFVNDAKQEVENAWNWSVLRNSYNVTGTGAASQFALTGLTNSAARLAYDECGAPLVFDLTNNDEFQLNEYPHEAYTRRLLTDPDSFVTNDKPYWFSVNMDTLSQWYISFDGNPANGRSYRAYFYVPQDELSSGTDTLRVPWRPVVNLALLYALDERGEEIGEPGSKAWLRYEKSLGDAIALDSVNSRHKINFSV